jgi:hypothetical protein
MLIHAPTEEKVAFEQPVQVMTGGASPPSAVIEAMEGMGFRVSHLYGLTESYGPSMVCVPQAEWEGLPLQERAAKMARQGVRCPQVRDMRVADPATLEPVPADGETLGEIMLRGNTIMKGYLKNPGATEQAFEGGWYRTGDLAVTHPDGYAEVKDRAKDIIISGGENISSLEVEEVLYRHPAVMEAAGGGDAGPEVGRAPLRLRGAQAGRRRAARGGGRRLVPAAHGPLQGPGPGRLRAAAEDLDRQDPEVRAQGAGAGDGRGRVRPPRSALATGSGASSMSMCPAPGTTTAAAPAIAAASSRPRLGGAILSSAPIRTSVGQATRAAAAARPCRRRTPRGRRAARRAGARQQRPHRTVERTARHAAAGQRRAPTQAPARNQPGRRRGLVARRREQGRVDRQRQRRAEQDQVRRALRPGSRRGEHGERPHRVPDQRHPAQADSVGESPHEGGELVDGGERRPARMPVPGRSGTRAVTSLAPRRGAWSAQTLRSIPAP